MSARSKTTQIDVRVRLFAILRERAGRGELELRLREGATVSDALAALSQREPLGELLARMPLRVAVNRDYADDATVLASGDELALIPPVSGGARPAAPGAARVHVRVSAERLSAERLARLVADPGAGAIVVFQGVTREVPQLDYEAYVEMAEQSIEGIARECVAEHGLRAAAIEHRVGSVELGEPSVIVAVSAAHRAQAFAGAQQAIDRLKADAPIWKRERARDGRETWL